MILIKRENDGKDEFGLTNLALDLLSYGFVCPETSKPQAVV